MKLTPFLITVILIGFFTGCSNDDLFFNPAAHNSLYPRLYEAENNLIYMSWMEERGDSAFLNYAVYDGSRWSDPELIVSGADWFVNWADYPFLLASDKDYMASAWLKKSSEGVYSYDIWMNTALNDSSFILHNDSTQTEHGFISMESLTDSTFMVVWLDGRKTADRNVTEYSDIDQAMTLRSAIVDHKGNILNRFLIDDSVCDCCNTSLTATDNGLVVFYRDRTENEIRDIKYSEFNGVSWTDPEKAFNDNWEIAACPVNGPSSDHNNKETVMVWFTGSDDTPEVKWSIFDINMDQRTYIADNDDPVGRVNIKFHANEIYISWIDRNGTLLVNKYDRSGKLIANVFSEDITKDRNTGFPQMAFSGKKLVIAWTDNSGQYPVITTRIVEQ